jgi:hypothetical protein
MQSIFEEMNKKSGNVYINSNSISYCSQIPWILNASVKNNILFGQDYDKEKYEK